MTKSPEQLLREHLSVLGRKGGLAKGKPKGLAALSPERRREIQSAGGKAKQAKLTDRQITIIAMCQSFESIERRNTDLAGWLALKLSVGRKEAEKMASWYLAGEQAKRTEGAV